MALSTFTVNLVSNCSMATYPENSLAHFTNLLPNPIELDRTGGGCWQVALLEISWPSVVHNVTDGRIEVILSDDDDDDQEEQEEEDNENTDDTAAASSNNESDGGDDDDDERDTTFQSVGDDDDEDEDEINKEVEAKDEIIPKESIQLSGVISRRRRRPNRVKKNGGGRRKKREIRDLSQGFYGTPHEVLQSVFQLAFRSSDESAWPLCWSVDPRSQKVKISKNPLSAAASQSTPEIRLLSQDLRNILGTETLQAGNGNLMTSCPLDIKGGCHTMFVYCDLIQNEVLGDNLTSLLRSVALQNESPQPPPFASNGGRLVLRRRRRSKNNNYDEKETTLSDDGGGDFTLEAAATNTIPPAVNYGVCYQSFAMPQWKSVVKSTFQSISITLRNETGALIPFQAVGRTWLTLQFRLLPPPPPKSSF